MLNKDPGGGNQPPPDGSSHYVLDVTLHAAGRFHEYVCDAPPPEVGAPVVIETERGVCLGWVRLPPVPATREQIQALPAIIRVATEADLLQEDRNREREEQAFRVCLQLVQQHKMEMKLVKVHYLLSASKAVFYFTADGRVDFRALVRDLAAELRVRIEMRQIGVRDETKVCGGVGHCGRSLCCSSWLRNFVPVSIRMAKDQNLALNPQKVSGACGRLMCCLAYEHETYVEMKKGLPKVGKRVSTTQGSGRVSSVEILKQRMIVELEDGGRIQIAKKELLSTRENEPSEEKRPKYKEASESDTPEEEDGVLPEENGDPQPPSQSGSGTGTRPHRRRGRRSSQGASPKTNDEA